MECRWALWLYTLLAVKACGYAFVQEMPVVMVCGRALWLIAQLVALVAGGPSSCDTAGRAVVAGSLACCEGV